MTVKLTEKARERTEEEKDFLRRQDHDHYRVGAMGQKPIHQKTHITIGGITIPIPESPQSWSC